jgi:mannan endo-1,4-beta-mannosidase
VHLRPSRRCVPARSAPLAAAAALMVALAGCGDLLDEEPRRAREAAPMIGAFVPAAPWNDLVDLRRLEAELGRRFEVTHWFTSWHAPYEDVPVLTVLADGRLPLITWQPHDEPVAEIAGGAYDDYVRGWARGVSSAPGLVYLRPFPEMNGDWTPWNGDPDALKSAWRRIAAIFAEEGASNVRWVFGPNVTDEPRTLDNAMERYYPGDDVVDVLALSGYNWGSTRPYIGWRDFETIFRSGYDRLTTLGPHDVWLAEIASAEEGGDKAGWVRDMFAPSTRERFPRLSMVVWFDEDKEADWRIASSPDARAAFREALATLTNASDGAHAAGVNAAGADAAGAPDMVEDAHMH